MVAKLYLFEKQGQAMLALLKKDQNEKLSLLCHDGEEIEVPKKRLYELPELEQEVASKVDLINLLDAASSKKIDLKELWESFKDSKAGLHCNKLSIHVFADNSFENHLALYLALIEDRTYFKRKENLFFARTKEAIEKLRQQREQQKKRIIEIEQVFKELIHDSFDLDNLSESSESLINNIKLLAAGSTEISPEEKKDANKLAQMLKEHLELGETGNPQKTALAVLKKLKIIGSNSHLIFEKYNWLKETSKQAQAEIKNLQRDYQKILSSIKRKDLSDLECITIDDRNTRDMDDAVSLSKTAEGYELGIHISDVASLIPKGSTLDKEALERGTSIYCPDKILNMFPNEIANNLASLVAGEKRACLSCLIQVDREYKIISYKILPTVIKVSEKLSYEEADQRIEQEDPFILDLYQITTEHETYRLEKGAIKAQKQLSEVDCSSDKLNLKIIDENDFARNLIAELMIIVNKCFAEFAAQNFIPAFFRCQDEIYAENMVFSPSYTDYTAKPHAALALDAYLHSSSPIRRYFDLCNQRQIIEFIMNRKFIYERKDLEKLSRTLSHPLRIAAQISKENRRFWLLKYLEENYELDTQFRATVVRNDKRQALVRLNDNLIQNLAVLPKSIQPGNEVNLTMKKLDPFMGTLKLEYKG